MTTYNLEEHEDNLMEVINLIMPIVNMWTPNTENRIQFQLDVFLRILCGLAMSDHARTVGGIEGMIDRLRWFLISNNEQEK